MRSGEPLNKWINEIYSFRQALKLWRLTQERDVAGLSEHIVLKQDPERGDSVWFHWESGSTSDLASQWGTKEPFIESNYCIASAYRPEMMRHLEHGDVVQPALLHVQQLVNRHLTNRVAPQMMWDDGWRRLGLHVIPIGLIGAIWLQFARAVTGNMQFRQCGRCEKFFELSPNASRTNKLFCSNACKTRSYRERQTEARQMHTAGISVEQITAKLRSDVKTVRRWVGQRT